MVCRPANHRRKNFPFIGKWPVWIVANGIAQVVGVAGRVGEVIFVIVSLQLLFIGLVGEYVLNINSRTKKRPLVIESERINF